MSILYHLSFVYGKVLHQDTDWYHYIADTLAERAVVIGDLSQRQMVIPKHENGTPKEVKKRKIPKRMVYNDWGLYRFVQMLPKLPGQGLCTKCFTRSGSPCGMRMFSPQSTMRIWLNTFRKAAYIW